MRVQWFWSTVWWWFPANRPGTIWHAGGMLTSIENKFAIVTGATKGIGRAIAGSLLDANAAVAICGRNQESVDATVNEFAARGRIVGIAADVSKEADVERLFEFVDREFGALDILINNAGVGIFSSVADLTPDQWRRVVDTNLTGAYYCCHQAMPRFRQRGSGFVINISSLAGKNPFAGGGAYNASKFGLNGFSEAMMLDHRQENVRVCSILPGSVNTDFGMSGNADWKIAPDDIAEVVLTVLRMPERTLVSRVEIRPSRPIK
jgi:3-oxoacyl-[acyl-carrier protein] reductase